MVEIRPLTENDVEGYAELRLQGLQDHPEAFASSYEEEKDRPLEDLRTRLKTWSTPENFVLGAWDGENLIGMVGFYREKHLKMQHKGVIWGMLVAPEGRGQGIGKKLMESAIERAKQLDGLEQINLTVEANNTAANQLYQSLGFEIYGVEIHEMKIGEQYFNAHHMVKKLC